MGMGCSYALASRVGSQWGWWAGQSHQVVQKRKGCERGTQKQTEPLPSPVGCSAHPRVWAGAGGDVKEGKSQLLFGVRGTGRSWAERLWVCSEDWSQ